MTNTRKPGWSLEQPFYVDPLIFRLDLDRVFRTGWLFAGHVCEIGKPGEYFCYEIAGDSLIIIRANDGEVRALFNVCRHRGSIICKQPRMPMSAMRALTLTPTSGFTARAITCIPCGSPRSMQ